jgi:hypothetical protein
MLGGIVGEYRDSVGGREIDLVLVFALEPLRSLLRRCEVCLPLVVCIQMQTVCRVLSRGQDRRRHVSA